MPAKDTEPVDDRANPDLPKVELPKRHSVKAEHLDKEMTFQHSDPRIVKSKTVLQTITEGKESVISNDLIYSQTQTFGREHVETAVFVEEFDGYDLGLVKTNSMNKKRKAKKNID